MTTPRPRRAARPPLATLALVAALPLAAALAGGCACPRCPELPPPPPFAAAAETLAVAPPPPAPPGPAAYEALREALHGRDTSPLRGRRVVLDPGHGGAFRGALGPGGLAEADVNLGVALHLRGLLEWAGAEAFLTRGSDRDFVGPADSSLARDLAARVAIADSLRPDVFVSIHHNSNAARDTTLNALETYYPAGRDGADLDLARAVHRHLARNLEVRPSRILPGNFRVLRDAKVPAVLGEAAMISNAVMERRLALGKKQELEAQAYFLGLLDYFAGGSPRWEHAYGDTLDEADRVAGPVTWRFEPGAVGGREGPPLDPASVELRLDGRPAPIALLPGGRAVVWRAPAPAPRAFHRLELRGRNAAGRATPVSRLVWATGGLGLSGDLSGLVTAATGGDGAPRTLLAWTYGDPRGARDWPPPSPLRLVPAGAGWDDPRAVALPCQVGGRGWALLPGEIPLESWDVVGHRFRGNGGLTVERFPFARHFVAFAHHDGRPLWLDCPQAVWPGQAVPGGSLRDRLPGADAGGALPPDDPLRLLRRGEPFWFEADGARPLVADAAHRPPWAAPGSAPVETLAWQPLLPALVGRVIVLDPAGGGADFDGSGPSGTRGSDLNLAAARALGALLRGAGATVVFTREDERWVAPEAKLLLTNEANADLFLTLRRARAGESGWTALHHATSAVGRRWARRLARAAAPLAAPDSARVATGASYLLRQTACPALEAALPPPRDGGDEDRLENPSHQDATARALFLAIAALLAGDEVLADAIDPAAAIAADREAFPPLERVIWARLDGNLPWTPPRWCVGPGASLSSCRAPGLPGAGPEHTLEVRTDKEWRLVALRRRAAGFEARAVFRGEFGRAPGASGN